MNTKSAGLNEVAAKDVAAVWPARYTLVGFMLVSYMIAWSDRINFSVATPKIMSTFGWSKTEMGVVLSAFTWAFVAFKLPAGWLADRYGGMKTMIGGLLFWSFITLLFPFSSTIAGMAVLRFLLGAGEIAYPPSQIRILARWFPDGERSKVNGICLASSDVAQFCVTPLAAWLLVLYDWRPVFYIFGGVGIAWAIIYWLWGTAPSTEARLNEQSATSLPRHSQAKISWRRLVRIRAIWGLVMAYVCLTYCYWLFLNWLPTYLVEARNFTILKMGIYAAIPAVAPGLAQVAAGWITAGLLARGYSRNFSRKAIIATGFLGAAFFMIMVVTTISPMLSVVYISASLALLGACYTPIWTIPTDLTSRWPGTVFGFAGTIGFIGGAVAPVVTGYIVDHTGSWHLAFYLASAISLVGFLVTCLFVSTDSIDARLAGEEST